MKEFISINNYNNNNIYINNNIIWLKKQIDELFPYKKKCLILNKEINKLQIECDIIKNKSEYDNKIFKEKEEINKLKIKKLKNKIMDSFGELIKSNSLNKLEELNSIFNDIGI